MRMRLTSERSKADTSLRASRSHNSVVLKHYEYSGEARHGALGGTNIDPSPIERARLPLGHTTRRAYGVNAYALSAPELIVETNTFEQASCPQL